MDGEVIEAFRSGMFRIMLENGHETLGYTAGKMRRFRIRILPGDKVRIELSPYDLTRGRRRVRAQPRPGLDLADRDRARRPVGAERAARVRARGAPSAVPAVLGRV